MSSKTKSVSPVDLIIQMDHFDHLGLENFPSFQETETKQELKTAFRSEVNMLISDVQRAQMKLSILLRDLDTLNKSLWEEGEREKKKLLEGKLNLPEERLRCYANRLASVTICKLKYCPKRFVLGKKKCFWDGSVALEGKVTIHSLFEEAIKREAPKWDLNAEEVLKGLSVSAKNAKRFHPLVTITVPQK